MQGDLVARMNSTEESKIMRNLRQRSGGGAFSSRRLGWFTGFTLVVLAVSCGSEEKQDPSSSTGGDPGMQAGAGGTTGATGGESTSEGGITGTEGGSVSSTGGTTGAGAAMGEAGNAGAGGQGDPGALFEPGADGPGYDGIDLDSLGLNEPPVGCVGGFDPDTGVLELTLESAIPALILSVEDGVVTANGTPCESEDGVPASTDALTGMQVLGTDGDDGVYIDGAAAFGAGLLSPDGDLALDLGEGDDQLTVLGSDGPDAIYLGSEGEAVWVDFSRDAEADIRATGLDRVLVSTGPKPDRALANGAALGIEALAVPIKLFGGGANDLLLGGAADDELHGGIGNDTLDAGADAGGADQYDGGAGEDIVDYAARTGGVVVTLAGIADDGEAGEGDDVSSNIEDVRGAQGPNTIAGTAVGNRLWGGPSIDVIQGLDGDDFIYGEAGDDELQGGNGDDYIYGEADDDTLSGGAGDDLLDGYPGKNKVDGGGGDADICLLTRNDNGVACEL